MAHATHMQDTRLPDFPADRADAVEERIFARIGEGRARATRRRRTGWAVGGAAAAVLIVAAAISPVVIGSLSGGAGSSTAYSRGVSGATIPDAAPQSLDGAKLGGLQMAEGASGTAGGTAGGSAQDAVSPVQRDVAATASQSLTVDDVAAAASAVQSAATDLGGYVESASIAADAPTAASPGDPRIQLFPSPAPGSWVQARVPADQLTALMERVATLGTVTASSITRQDVTDQTVDLRARVDATQAAVDRLTQLVAQATSVSDLIAAENALADRQATLESYRQQLATLEGQVAMSTLTVSLSPTTPAVQADPAGFLDGLAAGWNGLVAALNGIVVGLGFLLPWLAVAAVLALIAWGVVRLVRRRRRSPRPEDAEREE